MSLDWRAALKLIFGGKIVLNPSYHTIPYILTNTMDVVCGGIIIWRGHELEASHTAGRSISS